MSGILMIVRLFFVAGAIFWVILYNAESKDTETHASAKKYRDQARENINSHLRKLAEKAKVNEKD